jgi:hypothetical protein
MKAKLIRVEQQKPQGIPPRFIPVGRVGERDNGSGLFVATLQPGEFLWFNNDGDLGTSNQAGLEGKGTYILLPEGTKIEITT